MKRFVTLIIAATLLAGLGLLLSRKSDTPDPKISNRLAYIELPEQDEGGEEKELDNPQLAFLQNYEMIKDPALGYPPLQRKINAYQKMLNDQKDQLASESAIPGVEWIERGPDNVGGRTRALMFDPSDPTAKKVWAGATGGGLWYNNDITDPGSVWQNATGFMGNLAISCIDYDPSAISTFYIGTGLSFAGISAGEGIWKSTDGGATWAQLSSTAGPAFGAIQDIRVTATGTVLAASDAGFLRSTDGGTSWTTISSGSFADIEIAANGDIYASTGVSSSGNLFKSTNDGQSLNDITPQSGGFRIEIATAPSNANVVYAVAEGGSSQAQDLEWFKKSDDGGESWTDVTIPLQLNSDCSQGPDFFTRGQAFFDLILAVHPNDEDIIIAGGVDLHRSMDGGDAWEPISYWTGTGCEDYAHADQHAIQFRPGFPDQAIFGNDGGIDYSTDVGSAADPSIERRIKGYNTVMFYSVAMANQAGSNVMIAGAQDNSTQRFNEPGINSTRDVFGGDGALTFIDQTNPNIQITSFVFNFVGRSTNAGRSFTTISNDQNSGRFINPADYDALQGMYFSAGGSNQIKRIQGIKETPQAQETITIGIGGGQISTIKVSPNVPKRVFVGTGSGNIYRIDSTHLTTMVVTPLNGSFEGNPGSFVSGIDIGASDDQLLITYSNFGATSVYETTNGGTSWLSREGNLPDIPVRDALYNPDNRSEVLLATELGIWSTTEFDTPNPVWESTNTGLASVRVDKLEYRSSDKLVAAATHGRGVFTSSIFSQTSRADFKSSTVVGYEGVPVTFTDGSLGSGGSLSWNFGDGQTSTDQNPSHTYSTPGTYDVSLTINDGADTETKPGYITILPSKTLPYTLADGGDFESNPDDFASASVLNEVNFWERGTPTGTLSTTSSGTNAWKTGLSTSLTELGYDYGAALYTPAFDLSDPLKDYTLKFRRSGDTRYCNAPYGLYVEYSLDGGTTWLTLGSSTEEIGQVNWYNRGPNFGCLLLQDISPDLVGWSENNTASNNIDTQVKLNNLIGNENVAFRFVTKVYSGIGEGYDRDGFMIDDFEIEATDPTADFIAATDLTPANVPVQFSYASNGADSFAWNFGDGNTSAEENPIHTYTTGGLYTVSLTIMANGIPVTETKTDFIKVISSRDTPYLLSDGGNFEVNQNDFSTLSQGGTPFELGVSAVTGKDGTASGDFAWVTGINETLYADNTISTLISPSFVMDEVKEYRLEFKAKFSFESKWDGFFIDYSTDLGQTFTKLNNNVEEGWYNDTSENSSVFGDSQPIFTNSTSGAFETFSTDISFLYPSESILFRFVFLTDVNTVDVGMALDDFQITASDPVPPTAEFTASATAGCSGQTITFTNTSTGSVKTYEWSFGANASPASATGAGPHQVTYTGTGTSSVSLRVVNDFGGEDTETKTDLISTTATHTPTITQDDTNNPEVVSLTASQGDSYQWYLNNAAIDGATDQVLLTSENGLYSVEVTIDDCAVRTAALNLTIIVTGLEDDIVFSKAVTVFPNPVRDELKIGISNSVMGYHHINFYYLDGRLMRKENALKDEQDEIFIFDISSMPQGSYLVQVVSPKGIAVKKIIKQ
jgi:PKD repeat protein